MKTCCPQDEVLLCGRYAFHPQSTSSTCGPFSSMLQTVTNLTEDFLSFLYNRIILTARVLLADLFNKKARCFHLAFRIHQSDLHIIILCKLTCGWTCVNFGCFGALHADKVSNKLFREHTVCSQECMIVFQCS